MLYKTVPAAFKVLDEATGVIEAIPSVFNNVDRAGERVLPGYFAKSLQNKLPKGVWMHDWTRPIAKTLDAKELLPGDPLLPANLKELGGLYVKGQINLDVQDGRDALAHLKFGSVDEFSFGYRNVKTAYDEQSGVRDLLEGEIFEWSPVLIGCNPATALLSAKELPKDPEELIALLGQIEAELRPLGLKTLDAGLRARLLTLSASIADELGADADPAEKSADHLDLERRLLAHRTAMVLS